MNHFTFLTNKQAYYGEDRLIIFKKIGNDCIMTDYAIALGGDTKSTFGFKGRWFTQTVTENNESIVTNFYDVEYGCVNAILSRGEGARPVLPFSSIKDIPSNGLGITVGKNGILEVEYGYYPQTAPKQELQNELDYAYKNNLLIETGNYYTSDSCGYFDFDKKFEPEFNYEYSYKGKNYVRVRKKENSYAKNFSTKGLELSNGCYYPCGKYIWIEVEPIKWYVDGIDKVLVSQKILFAGIQFDDKTNGKVTFENSNIKRYMDTYFSKEFLPSNKIPTNEIDSSYFFEKYKNQKKEQRQQEKRSENILKILKELDDKKLELDKEYQSRKEKLQQMRDNLKLSIDNNEEILKKDVVNMKKIIRKI